MLRAVICGARRQALGAVAQFRQSHHREIDTIFVHLSQPANDAWVRQRLHPFRDNGCVQQEAHKSSSRGESFTRFSCKLESRRGEAAKNSARFPTRRVLRSHSSAQPMTAASWPLRVMVCGPRERARSRTSLNLALASATVHWVLGIGAPHAENSHHSHYSHYSHFRAEGKRKQSDRATSGKIGS